MPRRPDMPCAGCGRLMWRGQSSLPQGRATCQKCRANGLGPHRTTPTHEPTVTRRPCSYQQQSINVIWSMSGPAIAALALRACTQCARPLEAVTRNASRCDVCWRELISRLQREHRDKPCLGCGRACWGMRCRECSIKPKSSHVYFPTCPCGARFSSRANNRRYCCPEHAYEFGTKAAVRNAYRARVGIPLNKPTPSERRLTKAT